VFDKINTTNLALLSEVCCVMIVVTSCESFIAWVEELFCREFPGRWKSFFQKQKKEALNGHLLLNDMVTQQTP